MRVSNYNIYVPLNNREEEYTLFHGFSGAIDVVSSDIFETLQKAQSEPNRLSELSEENIDILKKRGYVTELSKEEERELLKKVARKINEIRRDKTFTISLVPTYGCNFRCPYCYAGKVLDRVDENFDRIIDEKMVDRIIDSIIKKRQEGKKIGGIGLCGGEPLLKESVNVMKYLVEKCLENNLRLSAITNGHDLDYYHEVLGKDKIDSLQITIDGLAEYHDNRRFLYGKKPTFDKIVENIDLCLEKGVRVCVRSNIDESNQSQIDGLLSFFKEKGWLAYNNFSHYFKGVNSCFDEEEKDNYIDDMRLMTLLSEKKLEKHPYEYNNMYGFIYDMLKSALMSNRYPTVHASHCSVPANGVVIDPKGNLYPCIELIGNDEYRVGCLDEAGEFKFNESIEIWRDRTVDNIEKCLDCAYALYCGGGCPVKAAKEDGESRFSMCKSFRDIFNEVVPHAYEAYLKNESSKE